MRFIQKGMRFLLLAVACLLSPILSSNSAIHTSVGVADSFHEPDFLSLQNSSWVNNVLATLSLKERIAQLIMIVAYPESGNAQLLSLKQKIDAHKVGGIILGKTPSVKEHIRYIAEAQAVSNVPLMVAADAEWGLAMRIKDMNRYPYNMTLGAVSDDSYIETMGRELGEKCRALGVSVNFGPVADINSNRNNPIINYRSFGEDRYRVSNKLLAMISGLQRSKVLSTPKHFPGHGDTDTDSHHSLPVTNRDFKELDSLEFFPFARAINDGVGGIMTAHIALPKITGKADLPSTLSSHVIGGILRDRMNFRGLVFTDAMNMAGVRTLYPEGRAELEALKAGCDVVEYVIHPNVVVDTILAAINRGEISADFINSKCRKVLAFKRYSNIAPPDVSKTDSLVSFVKNRKYNATISNLYKKALTLTSNTDSLLPLKDLRNTRVATIVMGASRQTYFQKMVDKYIEADHYYVSSGSSDATIEALVSKLEKSYTHVLAGVYSSVFPRSNYGVSASYSKAIRRLSSSKLKSIVSLFGSPYGADRLSSLDAIDAMIFAYEQSSYAEEGAAQLIFGGIGASGRLPISTKYWEVGTGIDLKDVARLSYVLPEEIDVDSRVLNAAVNEVLEEAVLKKAFPGCQILIAKDGKVFYDRNFGYLTYDKRVDITNNNLYDLASLTKIMASAASFMSLYGQNKFALTDKMSKYALSLKGTNKENMRICDVLTHQAGLPSWVAIWPKALDKNKQFRTDAFSSIKTKNFSFSVCNDLYTTNSFRLEVLDVVRNSKLNTSRKYLYSDLGLYFAPEMVRNMSGKDFASYLSDNIYSRIGASTMCFNPANRYPINRIAPTENDRILKRGQVQGYVHDEGAALLGGVSGHAGLFASAGDVAKMMQMYLQEGYYGGVQVLRADVVKKFSQERMFEADDNRRGLLFDKPYLEREKEESGEDDGNYPCSEASDLCFGHTGFTGTYTWADPQNGLLFVFISNRVYPTRQNRNIYALNIRQKLLKLAYKFVNESKEAEQRRRGGVLIDHPLITISPNAGLGIDSEIQTLIPKQIK
ncbi:MAG: glycoside hydrolase family 3 N-terminal domain-containing protein [Bacteroidales bacterium]